MSRNACPAVFLAFANELEARRYLRRLNEEQRRVRSALAAAEAEGWCEVVAHSGATARVIFDVFQDSRYRDRVAVFHFGGHAGSGELVLETPGGGASAAAPAAALAALLGEQRGLDLVFLNGCSSKGQVDALHAAGVGAVIATSSAIDDAAATDFAARFYQGLASGATVTSAFREARAFVEASLGNRTRDAWELCVRPGDEERIERWSLARLAVPKTGRVEVPPLLPYMSDRTRQRQGLKAALDEHRQKLSRRPLALLVHGDDGEAHEQFIRRLRDWTLPRYLGLDGHTRKIHHLEVEWSLVGKLETRFHLLRRDLAEKLRLPRDAEVDDMVRAVCDARAPLLVVSKIFAHDWRDHRLIAKWLDFFAGFDDLPPGQLLVPVLVFIDKSAAWRRLLSWKPDARRRTEKLVRRLVGRPAEARPKLEVVALERLRGVSAGEVVNNWLGGQFEEHAGELLKGATVGDLQTLADRLQHDVREFFKVEGFDAAPMEQLAARLRTQLDAYLNGGA